MPDAKGVAARIIEVRSIAWPHGIPGICDAFGVAGWVGTRNPGWHGCAADAGLLSPTPLASGKTAATVPTDAKGIADTSPGSRRRPWERGCRQMPDANGVAERIIEVRSIAWPHRVPGICDARGVADAVGHPHPGWRGCAADPGLEILDAFGVRRNRGNGSDRCQRHRSHQPRVGTLVNFSY